MGKRSRCNRRGLRQPRPCTEGTLEGAQKLGRETAYRTPRKTREYESIEGYKTQTWRFLQVSTKIGSPCAFPRKSRVDTNLSLDSDPTKRTYTDSLHPRGIGSPESFLCLPPKDRVPQSSERRERSPCTMGHKLEKGKTHSSSTRGVTSHQTTCRTSASLTEFPTRCRLRNATIDCRYFPKKHPPQPLQATLCCDWKPLGVTTDSAKQHLTSASTIVVQRQKKHTW